MGRAFERRDPRHVVKTVKFYIVGALTEPGDIFGEWPPEWVDDPEGLRGVGLVLLLDMTEGSICLNKRGWEIAGLSEGIDLLRYYYV